MKKSISGIILLLGLWLSVAVGTQAQATSGNYPTTIPITVQEADGSPKVVMPTKIIFPNGTVSVIGRTVTITAEGISGLAAIATSGSASDLSTGSLALARIAQGGATNGQVLAWNGSAWAPSSASGGGIGSTGSGFLPYSDGTTFQSSPLSRVSSSELNLASGAKFTFNTTTGNPTFVFKGDPSVTAVYESLAVASQPASQGAYWTEGFISNTGNTGAITYNTARFGGYNILGPAVRRDTTQPALWWSWEGSYDPGAVSAYPPSASNGFPWFEPHMLDYISAAGNNIRLISFAIRPGTTTPAPATVNGHVVAGMKATVFQWTNLEDAVTLGLQRGSMQFQGLEPVFSIVDETASKTFAIQNSGNSAQFSGVGTFQVTQGSGAGSGQAAFTVDSVANRYNFKLNYKNDDTGTGGWTPLQINNSSTTLNSAGQIDFNWGGNQVGIYGAQLSDTANYYGNAYIATRGSDGRQKRLYVSQSGLGIGTNIFGSSAANVIALLNGTAPSTSPANAVQLWSESAELKVRDGAGNVTTLSPHNFSGIPDGASEPLAWSYDSSLNGIRISVDMMRIVRLLEQLSGEKLVFIRDAKTGQEISTEEYLRRFQN